MVGLRLASCSNQRRAWRARDARRASPSVSCDAPDRGTDRAREEHVSCVPRICAADQSHALQATRAPHDTVFLERYRVAAGIAQPIHDYLLPHDFHHFHDYFPLHDPSYPTIPPWKSLPESHPGAHSLDPLKSTHAAPNSTHRHSTHHSSGTQLKSPPPAKSPGKQTRSSAHHSRSGVDYQ